MKIETCGHCGFSYSEADRAWDIARASGHCPKCLFPLNGDSGGPDSKEPPQSERQSPTGYKAAAIPRDSPRAESAPSPRRMRIVFGTLRTIRGIAGVIGGYQVLQLLPAIGWLSEPNAVTPNMLALFVIKLTIAGIGLGLFFFLRRTINNIHIKYYRVPHPVFTGPWRF